MPLEVSSKHALLKINDLKQGSLTMPDFIMTLVPVQDFRYKDHGIPATLSRMQTPNFNWSLMAFEF